MNVTVADVAPRAAVCVCTQGRERQLGRLLSSLEHMDLGNRPHGSIELLVIDNLPSEATRQLCERAASRLPIGVHYEGEPVSGITHARNRAVAVALERRADLLAFIDDDDQPRPDWLLHLLERQSATGADLVFGTWELDPDLPQWVRDSGIFQVPGRPKRDKGRRYGLPRVASGCNLLVGRGILLSMAAAGPVFDHRFCRSGGEDKDFCLRAHRLGATFASADRSIIQRGHARERYTVPGLLRRGLKNGCSRVSLAAVHGDRRRRHSLVATAACKLLFLSVTLPLAVFSGSALRHHLYRMAKSSGVIYASLTGKGIRYYAG